MKNANADPRFEVLEQRVVYVNPWMTIREDTVRRPEGSIGIQTVVERPDFAVVVPLYENGDLHVVEQYRHPVAGRFWEFPQGSWNNPNGNAADLAAAELREEAGLVAGEIRHVGRLHEAYGYVTSAVDVFVATGLRTAGLQREDTEEDMRDTRISQERFRELVRSGSITDAPTLAAWAFHLDSSLHRAH